MIFITNIVLYITTGICRQLQTAETGGGGGGGGGGNARKEMCIVELNYIPN